MNIHGTPVIKSRMCAGWAMDSTQMNNKVIIGIAVLLALLLVACDSQSKPHSVEESWAAGVTQNAIAGDNPRQSFSKATKGLAQKEVIEALGAAIEVSGADAEVAAREYAEQTDPITGGIFVGLVQILRFLPGLLIFTLLLLLSLGPICAMAKKSRP